MQETDALAAMLNETPIPQLRNGMVLERFGKPQAAELAYLEGLRNQSVVGSLDALETLQERWKECASNLRKWNALFEYGKMNHDYWVLLDCYGKSNIWE